MLQSTTSQLPMKWQPTCNNYTVVLVVFRIFVDILIYFFSKVLAEFLLAWQSHFSVGGGDELSILQGLCILNFFISCSPLFFIIFIQNCCSGIFLLFWFWKKRLCPWPGSPVPLEILQFSTCGEKTWVEKELQRTDAPERKW